MRWRTIDDALSTISSPSFELALKGVSEFGSKNPRALWAGVSDPAQVTHLARKIETAIQRIGLPAEERKFTPHVTLARPPARCWIGSPITRSMPTRHSR